jgi:oligopeptide transport system substrate-binding protein
MKKYISLVLLAAVLFLPNCTKTDSTPEDFHNRFLNFSAGGEPENIDPGYASESISTVIISTLFEGLVSERPKDGDPLPAAAEKWIISKDKKVYTFHLRKNVKWSDGSLLTAHDFVYSWERVLNPKTAAQYAFIMYYIQNAKAYNKGELTDFSKVGVRALGEHKLKITLENPTPFFLDLLTYSTFSPVPQHIVEKFGDKWTRPKNIISNGPFMMKSWRPHDKIVAVKNPHYWGREGVSLSGIKFFSIEDNETELKMYESGLLDLAWNLPHTKAPIFKDRLDFQNGPKLATYYYVINVDRPYLKNQKIRQALSMAIDRKLLCEKYLNGIRIPSSQMVPAYLEQYSSPKGLDFNPEKARALLKEAGINDPRSLPPLTITYNTDEGHKLVAQVIQQMWKEHLGIKVNLMNEEWKSLLRTLRAKNFDIGRYTWIADYPDPMTFLEIYASDSPQNLTGWKNKSFDQLLKDATHEPDPQRRLKQLKKAESILLNEAAVIPIYVYNKAYLIAPHVRGFYKKLNDRHPLKNVYFAKDKQ